VTLHTTLGDLKLEIHCDLVPRAAENFMALCASGYYNDTVFHRLIKGFMVQGGDPTGTGKGGTSIWGRKFPDEFDPTLQVCALCATLAPISLTLEQHNARGVVSMANSGPDTNGSQFFITFQKQPHLNQQYTIIGRYVPPRSPRSRSRPNTQSTRSDRRERHHSVIGGLDTLDAIERIPTDAKDRPLSEIRLESVTIHANPLAD